MLRLFHRLNKMAKGKGVMYILLVDGASMHVWAAKMLDPNGSTDTCFNY